VCGTHNKGAYHLANTRFAIATMAVAAWQRLSLSSKAKDRAESDCMPRRWEGLLQVLCCPSIILFQEKRGLCYRDTCMRTVYTPYIPYTLHQGKSQTQHATHIHTHTRGVSNPEPGIYTLRSFCAREGEREREWGKLTKTSRR